MRSRSLYSFFLTLAGALAMSVLLSAAPGDTPVADAAQRGDREAVRELLKGGADVNAAHGDGMTALHWAAMKEDADLVSMLLYAGANVKATTRLGGYTPLILAAKQGSAPAIQALLKAGADPKTPSATGATPLMFAAASGRADAVQALLDAGSDVNARETSMQQTPLMFAAANGRLEAMKVLIAAGADVKATSKVVDLGAFTREIEEQFRQFAAGGAAPPPGQAAGQAGAQGQAQQAQAQQQPPRENNAPAAQAPRENNTPAAQAQQAAPRPQGGGRRGGGVGGVDRQYFFNELVAKQGGLTPLLFAIRQGRMDAVKALIDAGADVNQASVGDNTSPLLMAIVNGHFDIAAYLLEKGANPNTASENGAAPLYATLNVQWAPKALYPQPRAYLQQQITYLDMLKLLLDKGADPNARLKKKVWYSGYNFDLSGVDEIGATPFWRAAYGADVDAMKLLLKYGADPTIPTTKPAGRPRTGDGAREAAEVANPLPPVPVGGPGVSPLQAAAGVGYGEGFAANAHRFHPIGMLAAVKFLVEEVGADVNARDHEGNTALHHAAARGDVEMIQYLVSKGADVKVVNREGQTTADMANGPVQRVQPFPEALSLLVKLGAKNNDKCVSC